MRQEIKERVENIRNGEVPEGYNETKVGIIPEDWAVKKLAEVSDIKTGPFGSALHQKDYVQEGTPIITVEHLGEQGVVHDNLPMVSDFDRNRLKSYVLKIGDIVFSRVGSVDRNSLIRETENGWLFSGRLLRIRVTTANILPSYISYHFHQEITKQRIRSVAVGQTMASLNTQILKDILVSFPPTRAEQQKIAEILSTWDTAIELKEKQILHSNKSKKGFMQKLLFKGVTSNILWSETQLRKCLVPTSYPVNKPSEPYYALGIRSHCKGTFVRHVEDPKKIAMDTLYKVKENELIVNITFAWEGAITLLNKKDEGKLVSHRFPTYKFNEEYTIPDYFKHLVKTKWFVFQLGSLSPGGAGRNRVFNKKDFLKLKILLPSVEEQKKIADFLNSIDNNIDLLNKELNQLKEQKKGLMQLLLTGIVRVEVY